MNEKKYKWKNFIPGFRSDLRWKKLLATFYYLIALIGLLASRSLGIFLFSLPFAVFYGGGLLKNKIKKDKSPKVWKGVTIISSLSILFSIIFAFSPTEENQVVSEEPLAKENNLEAEFEEKEEELNLQKDAEEKVKKVKEKKEKEEKERQEKLAEEKKRKEEEDRLAREEERKNAEAKKKEEEERLAAKKAEEKKLANNTSSNINNQETANTNESSKQENKKDFPKLKETATNTDYNYLLNVSTGKFHKTHCTHAKKTKEPNRKYSNDRDSIINSGYQPCKVCCP